MRTILPFAIVFVFIHCGCTDNASTTTPANERVRVRVLPRDHFPVEHVEQIEIPELREGTEAPSGPVEQFRATKISQSQYQYVILDPDDPHPVRHVVQSNEVKVTYFQKGMERGPIKIVKTDAADRKIEVEHGGKVYSVDLGPDGVRTNCWVEIISIDQPMVVYILRLGDKLGPNWTLKSVQENSIVIVNQEGTRHLIPTTEKQPNQAIDGD